MNLKDFISLYLPPFERILERKIEGKGELQEAMRYALFPGGKRFRPLLVMASTYAVNGKVEDSLETAVAIELIHNFTLVHDDLPCIDNDDFRRGKPTVHKKFGEGMAVLVGDALFNLAFQTLSFASLPAEKKEKIFQLISSSLGIGGVIEGQVMDIHMGKEENIEKLKKIYSLKTGALIKASVLSGGVIGDANEEELALLGSYGENLGLAFQIMDDVREAEEGKEPPYPDFPALLSIEGARNKGREYGKKAIEAVRQFGERGKILKEMVEWVIR
ncbi:polyprenyl synthetase family protein [Candidatus Calescamantes bacterium]|nr:polyprenyl synthetase family protein [Candidatus Calescamantes bacterium]